MTERHTEPHVQRQTQCFEFDLSLIKFNMQSRAHAQSETEIFFNPGTHVQRHTQFGYNLT